MKHKRYIKNKSEWNTLFALLKPKRLQIVIIVTCTTIIYITSFAFPLALQKGIDAALAEDNQEFYWMISLSISASLTEIVFSHWRLITITKIGTYLELLLCGRLMRTILNRAYTKNQIPPGVILNTANRISCIKEFSLYTAPQTVLEVGQAVISFIIIIHFSPIIALITFGMVALSMFILKHRSSNLSQHLSEHNAQESHKQSAISATALSLKNIKYHALESFSYRRTLRHIKNATVSLQSLLLTSAKIQFWGSLTSRAITLVILASGCMAIASGELSIGEFLIIQLLASRLSTLLSGSSDILTKYQEAKSALEKIKTLNKLPAEPNAKALSSKNESNKIFSLVNLTLEHSNRNLGLDNVSLELQKPGLIVLTGISGSGKSTLSQALLGLYERSSGDIYYNGNNISTHSLRSLRKK